MASPKSSAPETKITSADIKAQTASAPAPASNSDSVLSFADFNNPTTGENYGGSFPPLELEVQQVSPTLVYLKDSKIILTKSIPSVTKPGTMEDIAETKKVAIVAHKNDTSKMFGLPISAIFEKNWKEADLEYGSEFVLARFPDSIKKRGEGAGSTKMKNYAMKVLKAVRKAPATV